MISDDLERFFAARGTRSGGAVLLSESDALALIDMAQRQQIAILGVDQCRTTNLESYSPVERAPIGVNLDRADSWRWARQFVTDLSGRGLLFEVALEKPGATRVHRFRDRTVPLRAWSAVFQIFFLSFLALLLVVVVGIS